MDYGWDELGRRFMARSGDELMGLVEVQRDGGAVTVLHTETAPAHQGEGIAGGLTQALMDDLRARRLTVVAVCPYTQTWLSRHPDYTDLIPG